MPIPFTYTGMVFMFSNAHSARTEANYDIRRLAVDFATPLITNLEVAKMLAEAIQKSDAGMELEPATLREYYDREAK